MTKTFGTACVQIAVLLTVFGSIQCASVTSKITTATTDNVDGSDEVFNKKATNQSIEDYDYYRRLLYVSKEETSQIWSQLRQMPEHHNLSSSHRRAFTVKLKFDFPFYGHHLRNVTVATGGFIYTGDHIHSWLAATQYVAPLMANFDLGMSNDSLVRLQDNGTAFTVVWENVMLQNKPYYGKFTFSATLHQNGDIVFVYYQLPTLVNNIGDSEHPVKVGLSDAYTFNKGFFLVPRMTIYEYDRVSLDKHNINNSMIIRLTALPTCLGYNDCQSCNNHNTKFECAWCPAVNRCSRRTGIDRLHQNWEKNGCERSLISTRDSCPTLPTLATS